MQETLPDTEQDEPRKSFLNRIYIASVHLEFVGFESLLFCWRKANLLEDDLLEASRVLATNTPNPFAVIAAWQCSSEVIAAEMIFTQS